MPALSSAQKVMSFWTAVALAAFVLFFVLRYQKTHYLKRVGE